MMMVMGHVLLIGIALMLHPTSNPVYRQRQTDIRTRGIRLWVSVYHVCMSMYHHLCSSSGHKLDGNEHDNMR
jgi:hypothetical protein